MVKKVHLKFVLFLTATLVCLIIFSGCKKNSSENNLSTDQQAILQLYASKYLSKDHQLLYTKSEARSSEKETGLLTTFDPPLTVNDFKLPEIAISPDVQIQAPDTLFSDEELKDWSRQIADYKQISWNQSLFPDYVTWIRKEQIPENNIQFTSIQSSQDVAFVHYISIPFVHNGKSALLYSRMWGGGAYVNIRYHYFIKRNVNWVQIKEGPLNIGY